MKELSLEITKKRANAILEGSKELSKVYQDNWLRQAQNIKRLQDLNEDIADELKVVRKKYLGEDGTRKPTEKEQSQFNKDVEKLFEDKVKIKLFTVTMKDLESSVQKADTASNISQLIGNVIQG